VTSLKVLVALLALAWPVALFVVARDLLRRHEVEVMPYARGPLPVMVEVPPGSSGAEAVAALEQAGVVRDRSVALALLRRSGAAHRVQAGEYRFERPLSPAEVLGKLLRGEVFTRTLTVPEGLDRFEIARRFARSGFGSEEEFLAASASGELVLDLDPEAQDLEGYLFPETYRLGRHDGAEALVRRMIEGFRRAVGPDAPARAAALGLSLRQAVTLASLVEKETSVAAERPVVAGVYLNRLKKRMLLQADPTVIYGLKRAGRYDGNLRRPHLVEDLPYNTYVRAGLPPGPIANPGAAALAAALGPEATENLYFVSKNDGSHVFAKSLGEHNRNVNRFQKLYWRERWKKERGGR
jgi:UPF0755 protein